MDLIIATRNKHKIIEIREIWSDLGFRFLSLDDLSQKIEIRETGRTFSENAIKKAFQVANRINAFVLADDSGIEVEALGGKPGVVSARYAGLKATDNQNNRKLLNALQGVTWEKRGARYRCVIALIDLQKKIYISEGSCEGIIAFKPSGKRGFGYDPIFYVPEYGMTMAGLSLEVKNRISHRARALQKTREIINRLLPGIGDIDLNPSNTL
ncbi:MAG: XTP/dITP diphosphatase [bacterium]